MTRPTDAANAEERIARIEQTVSELAGVEQLARQIADDVRKRAERIAAESGRLARAHELAQELQALEVKVSEIATEVASKTALIAAELSALKEVALQMTVTRDRRQR